jgi:hypothetical protein
MGKQLAPVVPSPSKAAPESAVWDGFDLIALLKRFSELEDDIERLHLAAEAKDETSFVGIPDRWILEGFLDDAQQEVEFTLKNLVEARVAVSGGASATDLHWMNALEEAPRGF